MLNDELFYQLLKAVLPFSLLELEPFLSLSLGATPGDAQGLPLPLHLGSIIAMLRDLDEMPGTKVESAMCKSNALTTILSL